MTLAVLRIAAFGALIWQVLRVDAAFFATLPEELEFPPAWSWPLEVVPRSELIVSVATVLLIAAALMALVGWRTRIAGLIAVGLAWYVLGVPQLFGKVNHYHHVLWAALLLSLAPSADALSVDAIRTALAGSRRGKTEPPKPSGGYLYYMRLFWVMLAVIYYFPGLAKLRTSNLDWIFSDNLQNRLYRKWFEIGWIPSFRIDDFPLLLQLMALGVVLFEIGFIVVVIAPRLRPYVAAAGVAFHVGTYLLMRIAFWTLLVLYVGLLDWDRMLSRIGATRFPERARATYGAGCEDCLRFVAVLRRVDIYDRIAWEAQSGGHFQLTDPDGLVYEHEEAELRRRIPLAAAALAVAGISDRQRHRHPWHSLERHAERLPIPAAREGRGDARLLEPAPVATAADEQRERLPKLVAALLVGAITVSGAIGAWNGWPLSKYPSFAGVAVPQLTSLEFVIDDHPEPYQAYDLAGRITAVRFGVLLNWIARQDEGKREATLEVLIDVLADESELVAESSQIIVYRATRSVVPEEWGDPPLEQVEVFRWSREVDGGGATP